MPIISYSGNILEVNQYPPKPPKSPWMVGFCGLPIYPILPIGYFFVILPILSI